MSSISSRNIPPIVDEVVRKALEWNVDDRYASAADMRKALLDAQKITGMPAEKITRPGAVRGWATLGVAAGAVLASGLLISRFVEPALIVQTSVAVEPLTFDGPQGDRPFASAFSEAATLALGQAVGISILPQPGTDAVAGDPEYVIQWSFVVDTTQTPPVAQITAKLLSAAGLNVIWTAPAVTTPMAEEELAGAAARIAQDIATEVRGEGRRVPP